MVPDVSKERKFLIFKGLETPRHWIMVSHVSKEVNAFIFEGLETWRHWVMVLDASKERLETPCHWIIDSRHFEDTDRRTESWTILSWTRRVLTTPDQFNKHKEVYVTYISLVPSLAVRNWYVVECPVSMKFHMGGRHSNLQYLWYFLPIFRWNQIRWHGRNI